jgi:hypothetical protein
MRGSDATASRAAMDSTRAPARLGKPDSSDGRAYHPMAINRCAASPLPDGSEPVLQPQHITYRSLGATLHRTREQSNQSHGAQRSLNSLPLQSLRPRPAEPGATPKSRPVATGQVGAGDELDSIIGVFGR